MIKKVGSKWVLFTADGSRRLGTHDTEAEAQAQEHAIEASKHRSAEIRQLHLRGALGAVRTAVHDGREHLVVPVVALMDGVIHAVNAATPERVTTATLIKAANSWNGRPLVLGHPVRNGRQCSANDVELLAKHGFGTIFNSRVSGTKLLMDAYVDPVRAEKVGGPEFVQRLRNGEQVEVSVGAFVTTDDVAGTHDGKAYKATWLETVGDHLAFLPNGTGACSIKMGCGAHRAAMRVCEDVLELETLGGPGSGPHKAGDTVRFNGKSADGKVDGSMTVKIVNPHSNADKVTQTDTKGRQYAGASRHIPTATVEVDRSKRGLPPIQFEAYHHTLKGLSMNPKSLKARILALFDTPEQAASEEAAELIAYNAMRTMFDAVGKQWDEVSGLIDDLIADEDENPTETPAEEEAETEVEGARLEAIRMLCYSMMTSLQQVVGVTYQETAPDIPSPSDPRYMEQLRAAIGKAISAKNMKVIQGAHDASHDTHAHTVALGADCNGMKLLAALPSGSQMQVGDRVRVNQPGHAAHGKSGKITASARGGTVHTVGDYGTFHRSRLKAAAAKDCPACDGTGQVKTDGKQQDCTSCDGTGVLKTAELKAACSCEEADVNKQERIAALLKNEHNPIKDLSDKTSDEVLTVLEAQAETNKKHAVELKAAQDKQVETEAALKAAQAAQIPPEELTELRALAADKKAADVKQKADLVASLKTAQKAYTEVELNEMTVPALLKIAQLAKVEAPVDYSGRGVVRAAQGGESFTPPNSYANALKTNKDSKAVN